jgi:hypothetical protein
MNRNKNKSMRNGFFRRFQKENGNAFKKEVGMARITRIILILLLLGPSLSGCTSKQALSDLPYCEGSACYEVAQSAPWPALLSDGRYLVDIDQFSFSLPSPPKRIYRLLGGDLYIFSEDGSFISFSLDTEDFLYDGTWPTDSQYTVADYSRFIFEKSNNDLDKAINDKDALIIKRALLIKEQIFENKRKVYKSEKGGHDIFYCSDFPVNGMHFAHIISDMVDNRYIRVASKGMSFERFKQILSTVKTINHQMGVE